MMKKYFFIAISCVFYGCSNHSNNQNKGIEYYFESGNIQYDLNNFLKAIDFYSLAYIQDSSNTILEYRIGFCYGKLDKYKESILYFNKSIMHKYRIGDSYYNIGICYVCLFNDSIALQFFEKALVELPKEQYIISEINDCKLRLQLKSKSNVSI